MSEEKEFKKTVKKIMGKPDFPGANKAGIQALSEQIMSNILSQRYLHGVTTAKIKRERFYFFEQNETWIAFLNCLRAEKKAKESPSESQEPFLHWQEAYGITQFKTEIELMYACHAFMYENLLAISRGERNELLPVGEFGFREAVALLNTRKILSLTPTGEIVYDNEPSKKILISLLSDVIFGFTSYINTLLENCNEMRFRIGVCRYQKKNLPECGKVYVGGKIASEVCSEHERKWSYMKADRKRRAKPEDENQHAL